MILLIDNYDSFTYNLYQYIGAYTSSITVVRNDKITLEEALGKKPSHIILSPGPGYPASAGICVDLIRQNKTIPMLGVCLGHQAIGEAFGGKIVRAPRVMHGKTDTIKIDSQHCLFHGLETDLAVGRYHSLVIDPASVPDELAVTATSSDGCIMGIAHKSMPIFGIQFHPESVLTPKGKAIIKNFITI